MHEGLRGSEVDQDRIDGGREGPDAADHRTARRDAAEIVAGHNGPVHGEESRMKLIQSQFILAAIAGAVMFGASAASAAPSNGEQLAFDRSKGNCLTCHEIKGGDAPGNIAPPLAD